MSIHTSSIVLIDWLTKNIHKVYGFVVIHLSCKYSLIKNFGRIAACRWVLSTDSWYLHKLDSKVQLHMESLPSFVIFLLESSPNVPVDTQVIFKRASLDAYAATLAVFCKHLFVVVLICLEFSSDVALVKSADKMSLPCLWFLGPPASTCVTCEELPPCLACQGDCGTKQVLLLQ